MSVAGSEMSSNCRQCMSTVYDSDLRVPPSSLVPTFVKTAPMRVPTEPRPLGVARRPRVQSCCRETIAERVVCLSEPAGPEMTGSGASMSGRSDSEKLAEAVIVPIATKSGMNIFILSGQLEMLGVDR